MKLAICFGGTYEMYDRAGTLRELERVLEKADQHSYRRGVHQLKAYFCYGLEHDGVLSGHKGHKTAEGETFAAPSTEVVAEIQRFAPDMVLFFGISGGVNTKRNHIYFPSVFYRCTFNSRHGIRAEDIVCQNRVTIHNILGNRFRELFGGARQLTANLAWSTWIVGPEGEREYRRMWQTISADLQAKGISATGKDAAAKWCQYKFHEEILPSLRGKTDLVDMESYGVVSAFPKNIGVLMMVSDELGENYDESRIDWERFNSEVIRSIDGILRRGS